MSNTRNNRLVLQERSQHYYHLTEKDPYMGSQTNTHSGFSSRDIENANEFSDLGLETSPELPTSFVISVDAQDGNQLLPDDAEFYETTRGQTDVPESPRPPSLVSETSSLKATKTEKKTNPIVIFKERIMKFLMSPPEQYKSLKTTLNFPVGLLFAYGLYKAIVERLPWPSGTQQLAGLTIGLPFTVGYAVSIQIRCMAWLILPTMLGKSGRSYIGTFALTYLILGPINNIILNGKEVTRSLSCAAELSANHSRSKLSLKTAPLRDLLLDIKREGFMIEEISQNINKKFQPIKDEIKKGEEIPALQKKMKEADASQGSSVSREKQLEKKYELKKTDNDYSGLTKKYSKKLDYRCEDVFSMGVLNCKKALLRAYWKCMDALPYAIEWLCAPLKLDFVCKLISLIPGLIGLNCGADQVVNRNFGETYSATSEMARQLDSSYEVNLQYKLEHTPGSVDATTAEEVKARTMKDFEDRKKSVDLLLKLITHLLTFTFILVIWSVHSYHKKYILDIRHDNHYVTAYFERIDERRKQQNKRTLLPPKVIERQFLIYPKKLGMMKAEIKKLVSATFKILFKITTAVIIVLFDWFLYWVLNIISKYSRIDYRQTGEHHIKMEVYGTGFMSDIVKMFLKNFDKEHKIDFVSTNFDCLPRPHKLSTNEIWPVFVIYVVTWILMIFQAYFLRLRRVIAGFFYRKREKRRVLYLYNEMLRKRRGFLRRMRHKVRRQLRRRRLESEATVLSSFRDILEKFGLLKKQLKCLICDEVVAPDHYTICDTPECGYGYCRECWLDCKELCYVCLPKEEHEKLSELTSDEFGN